MHPRGALACAAALCVSLAPARALAWQEAHQTGDDIELRIEPDGKASLRHALRWHVVHGPLKSIDLLGIDPSAEVEGDVPIKAEDGRAFVAHAARVEGHDEKPVRILVDEPRAIMRGVFTFWLTLHVDLASTRGLTRDGATWRLAWSSPIALDGFDGARSVLTLPAAPDAPRAILADTGAADDAAVTTLHREPGEDVLELVRPHVARGEAVTWTVRVDPRAFPGAATPALRADPPPRRLPEPNRLDAAALLVSLGALALLQAWLVRSAGRKRGPQAPQQWDGARAVLSGISLAAGVALQVSDEPTWGAAFVALSTVVAALGVPKVQEPPRGPGRWLVLRPEEVFASFDPLPWRAAGGLAALVAGIAGLLAWRGAPYPAWLLAIDAAGLAPLLMTSRESSTLQAKTRIAGRWLSPVFQKLARRSGEQLRVFPWARVPAQGADFDELRLLVQPRLAMPGLIGLEVGVAWASTPVGPAASPEVLARVLEESPAAAKLTSELPFAQAIRGRRPEERVVRMLPRTPTQASTVALVCALVEALTDRRVTVAPRHSAPERRGKPSLAAA